MTRTGWPIKEAGAVLGIHPNKVTQSIDPAFRKIARLMRADSGKTMRELTAAMEALDPMSEAELDLLTRIQRGRVDRSELRP